MDAATAVLLIAAVLTLTACSVKHAFSGVANASERARPSGGRRGPKCATVYGISIEAPIEGPDAAMTFSVSHSEHHFVSDCR
eukprot:4475306-Prymnesium_polylepis.2